MVREESYGIIPLLQEGKIWRVFLVQHRKGDHWSFPKGHREQGEEPKETALRELLEETGLGIKRFLSADPIREEYSFLREGRQVVKSVTYYLAETVGVYHLDPVEIQNGRWFSLEDAALQLTFPEAREILAKAEKVLRTC